MYMKTDR